MSVQTKAAERVARYTQGCEHPELTIWLLTEAGWVEEERLSLEEAQALLPTLDEGELRDDIVTRLDVRECDAYEWCHAYAVNGCDCWEHGGNDDV